LTASRPKNNQKAHNKLRDNHLTAKTPKEAQPTGAVCLSMFGHKDGVIKTKKHFDPK
jgi:hypothetical protein